MTPYYEQDGVTIYHGDCRKVLPALPAGCVDAIITSPPYNLGSKRWDCGGAGRAGRMSGIGYRDDLPEQVYQQNQIDALSEMYRVCADGASCFYNHKVRVRNGVAIHPMLWLTLSRWLVRQEIVWDRENTHNFEPTLFWNVDERIYWLTKGRPALPDRPIGVSTVWRIWGPVPNTEHPAPFRKEIPIRCLRAVDRDGITVLDPYCGSGTTLGVAKAAGKKAIGIEIEERYCEIAAKRLAQGALPLEFSA